MPPPAPSSPLANPSSEDLIAEIEVLTQHAHTLREQGSPDSLRASVPAYDEALAAWQKLGTPADSQAINQTASLWMKRGIALLTLADREALAEALRSFDQAIALRSQLKLEGNPWYRWVLTAGWMNRADALTRLGSEPNIREALRCYDLAIAHLQILPVDEEPKFRWRLAVAWLNRGLTCLALNQKEANSLALLSFDNSIALLKSREDLSIDEQRTLAAAWFNRANALINDTPAQLEEARVAAKSALQITRHSEPDDLQLAEAGIKSRHVLCRALAQLLEMPAVNPTEAEGWIIEATDAVEDSLQFARHWEARKPAEFRPFLEQMFHFGTRIYRAFQPHFLAEFLQENQASVFTPAMHQAAREALNQAALQIRSEGLAHFNPRTMERLLGTLAALTEAGENLAQRHPNA